MKFPLRMPASRPAQKLVAGCSIAILATVFVVGFRAIDTGWNPLLLLDELLYDAMYRLRPIESKQDSSVIMLALDDRSLELMDQDDGFAYGWPWPRTFWGETAKWLANQGAKAIVIDLVFTERSPHGGDDEDFANTLAEVKAPVIIASRVKPDGTWVRLRPPIKDPTLGAANVGDDKTYRQYLPYVYGVPSLAVQAVKYFNSNIAVPEKPFRLHYYGPHLSDDGQRTFKYIAIFNVIAVALEAAEPAAMKIDPAIFTDKIVVVAPLSTGLMDLKSTPLSREYPGAEVHATAIENMLNGQYVAILGTATTGGITLIGALLASLLVIYPHQAWMKLAGAGMVAAGLLALGAGLFLGDQIHWLPLAAPLVALILTTVVAFAYSYLTEDKQRRAVLKALSQYISPHVAEKIGNDPEKLELGGERREMTVLFTDIAGFTDLSETLEVEKLSTLLNFYLEHMSAVVLENDGTLDKYVGDAIMSFWNAPLEQANHAVLACRAALGMKRREEQITPELQAMGATKMYTRLGINTGPMSVGNMGSSRKFNYTVLGDSVNLGARLEGANKMYGTRIMIAESTAKLVDGQFLLRKLDVMRVKGKLQPVGVYELMSEAPGDEKLRNLAQRYEAAFVHYQRQEWDLAEAELLKLQAEYPYDGPVATLLGRIEKFRLAPPAPDWDGVYVAKEK